MRFRLGISWPVLLHQQVPHPTLGQRLLSAMDVQGVDVLSLSLSCTHPTNIPSVLHTQISMLSWPGALQGEGSGNPSSFLCSAPSPSPASLTFSLSELPYLARILGSLMVAKLVPVTVSSVPPLETWRQWVRTGSSVLGPHFWEGITHPHQSDTHPPQPG